MASTSAIAPGCRREDPALPTPPVIAIANQKGGVGKTTSTAASPSPPGAGGASWRSTATRRPASRSTSGRPAGARGARAARLLAHARGRAGPGRDLIVGTMPALIGSSIRLASGESELVGRGTAPRCLRERLHRCASFDIILIDAMPRSASWRSTRWRQPTHVLIPVKTDYLSLMGVSLLLETVDRVRQRLNPELRSCWASCRPCSTAEQPRPRGAGRARGAARGDSRLFPPVRRSTVFDQASVGGAGLPAAGRPAQGGAGLRGDRARAGGDGRPGGGRASRNGWARAGRAVPGLDRPAARGRAGRGGDRPEPGPAAAARSTRPASGSWRPRSSGTGCCSRSWCGEARAASSWSPVSGGCSRSGS